MYAVILVKSLIHTSLLLWQKKLFGYLPVGRFQV